MSFNTSGAVGGGLTGAKMGTMIMPGIGTAIGGGLGALAGGFMGGGDDIGLEDMRSKEQREAAKMLFQLGKTGSMDGLTLGEAYGGDLGYYQQGTQGLSGGTALENLMMQSTQGTGDFGAARDVYSGLASLGEFNPDDPKWGYSAYNKALAKAGEESSDVLERESAITGSRFSTSMGEQKADLAENLNLQRQQRLGEMFQSSQQFAALGAQGLTGLADQTAQLAGLNINYDDYQRQLKDTKAKDALTEFKRQRSEELSRIDILSQEANRNPYMGVSSLPGSPSPFSSLTNSILGGYGEQLGTQMGKGGLGSIFNFGSGATSTSGSSGIMSNGFDFPAIGSLGGA